MLYYFIKNIKIFINSRLDYRLTSLLLLTGIVFIDIAFPKIAFSQSISKLIGLSTIEDRLVQLERIYDAHSQLLIQLQKQISENQSDIESLRGQIQDNQHQLNQMNIKQEHILAKIDSIRERNNSLKLDLDKQNRNILLGSDNISNVVKMVKNKKNNSQDDYNLAIMLMREKLHHDEAIAAFKNFVAKYPDSIYQPNANYWLGQLSYNCGKKDDAIYYFSSVIKNHPQSQKASDAMYKIGLIMQNQGSFSQAKTIFQQVEKKYPGTESAKQAKKHLGLICK